MLEQLCIVSTGGIVLWQHTWAAQGIRRNPINRLIQDVLLEGRSGEKEFATEEYRLQWALANETKFVVVAVYQKFLQLVCLNEFLDEVKTQFEQKFGDALRNSDASLIFDFHGEFSAAYAKFEVAERMHEGRANGADASPSSANQEVGEESSKGPAAATAPSFTRGAKSFTTASGRVVGKRGGDPRATKQPPAPSPTKKKPAKLMRNADGTLADGSNANAEVPETVPEEALSPDAMKAKVEAARNLFLQRNDKGEALPTEEKKWASLKRGRLETWLRSRFGDRKLDDQDFDAVLPALEQKLVGKNVAVEIATKVCADVRASLSGKRIGTLQSLPAAIEAALVETLRQLLVPRHDVNILRDVEAAKARRKPYSIVFCGVNGVGKSTSLAKVAYWLQQNGNSILIAACDTFRHGAVEQLQVHGNCLDVPIFQQGYGGDSSIVAGNALQQAAKQNVNVVLIDTAGRMQDHEARMRALAKLIHDNQPDLVLFVGEALVGNNGIDQLRKFNQCLRDFTPIGSIPRGIDGIFLTKFDTIDDKVGAALSMVHEIGQPIVFVGVGQTYQDLKAIDAEVVVSALMS